MRNSFLKSYLSTLAFICVLMGFISCEHFDFSDRQSNYHLVTLRIHGFNYTPFPDADTRSSLTSSSVSRLDLALFNPDDSKFIKLNQQSDDPTFGSPQLNIPDGTYTLVIIAHSGTGVATITSPDEVTFPSNKVTDTFYTCQSLTVDESTTSLDVTLQRAVAMVRVILTDTELPSEFSQLQLYYTGGSSTFSPQAGFGSKNSRQTEIRQLADATHDSEGHPLFEIYTFPHIQESTLKLTLTPQDAQGNQIAPEYTIPEVPIRLNYITEARGSLFTGGISSFTSTLAISIHDQWEGTTQIDFN